MWSVDGRTVVNCEIEEEGEEKEYIKIVYLYISLRLIIKKGICSYILVLAEV